MTKILFNGNRIIIDGHADSPEECKAITAMCDSMANDENFKTIVYESGHAVFEQVSGGDSMMFAMKDYVLKTTFDQTVGEINGKIDEINKETGYSAAVLAAKGPIANRLYNIESFVGYNDGKGLIIHRLSNFEERIAALEGILSASAEVGQYLKVSAVDENGKITALEPVSVPAEYQLPYTASELVEKLSAL
jgi:hypothetical protein